MVDMLFLVFHRVFVSTTDLESFSLRPEKVPQKISFGGGRVRFFLLCHAENVTLGSYTPKFRNFPVTPTPILSQKYCRTNGRRTAVQMEGVLQYKWEVYCWVSPSSRLRNQEGPAIQMGGVLPYRLEVYCRTFFETSMGLGFPKLF